MNKLVKVLAVAGAVCISTTLLILLLLTPVSIWNATLAFPSLITLIFFELIFFSGLIFIEKKIPSGSQIITRSGCTITLVICSLIGIFASLLFFTTPLAVLPIFIATFTFLLTILILGFGLFWVIGQHRNKKEKNTINAINTNNQYVSRLKNIAISCKKINQREEITKLAEKIRFSNNVITTKEDQLIDNRINEIYSIVNSGTENDEILENAIQELSDAIDIRGNEIEILQRGNF